MATTKFNTMIISAARRLGDVRSDATSAGDGVLTYSSAVLSDYGNRAIRKLVVDSFQALGVRGFIQAFPEMLKRMPGSASASNALAKPSDAYIFVDLYDQTGDRPLQKLTDSFERVQQQDIPLKTMSFYESESSIYTSPDVSASATLRGHYIISHPDVTPSNAGSPAAGGKYYSGGTAGSWTAASRTLTAPSLAPTTWATTDVGKLVVFHHGAGSAVYHGHIESRTDGNNVVLKGSNIPGGDLAGVIGHIYMAAQAEDNADMLLNRRWLPILIDMMVDMAVKDAVASIDIG